MSIPIAAGIRTLAGGMVFATTLTGIVTTSLVTPPRSFHRVAKASFRLMLRTFGVKVRMVGFERLDPQKAYLFIANHVSWMDHLIALGHLPQFLIGLEKLENFKLPLYGWAIRRWGQVSIDRSDLEKAKESCRVIQQRLESGTCVMLFPEGTRTLDGTLGPFKKGVFHIAIETGATVVPVAFRGLRQICPRGSSIVRPGTVEMVFQEPISCAGLTVSDLDALSAKVRAEILAGLGQGESRQQEKGSAL